MADDTETTEISLASAASIGIGGMVGAGIFAILGLAATTTQGAVPIAFVIGGVIALVTAHCYGKRTHPSTTKHQPSTLLRAHTPTVSKTGWHRLRGHPKRMTGSRTVRNRNPERVVLRIVKVGFTR